MNRRLRAASRPSLRHEHSKRRPLPSAVRLALLSTTLAVAAPALAQDDIANGEGAEVEKMLDQIFVIGSRRVGGSDTESPLPVDSIPMERAASEGPHFDLAQTLQNISPSFNSTRQTGADGADLVDSAALRGLGSDQTLVLVDGKRLHSVALVNLFGARNRGNTGTDFNTIPLLAVERIDVLRDGAAAQYGSDAIAGVINVALKRSEGCEGVAGYGEYTRGDGENVLGSAYCGFRFGNDARLSITGEGAYRGRSDRSGDGNPRTIGDSQVRNRTLYLNGDMPVTDEATLYFVAGAQRRFASSGAFAREGLGSEDIPSRNSAAMYPDGFVPFIEGDLDDRHLGFGLRGNIGEWYADASWTHGYNRLLYTIDRTLNASIANLDRLGGGPGVSATRFDAGGFAFRQDTFNADFSRYFDTVLSGLNTAFGFEYRRENYEIFAGEPGSYIDADGPGGGNAGSQGFPGFQPGDETDTSRHSWAAYLDLEAELGERSTGGFALRYEDYSDFGSTLTGKLALGFRASDTVLLRGSASTGFRAPSLQQRLFSSTFTDFISGEPVDVLLAPNGGLVANAAGIPALQEETSTSFTAGFTWTPNDAWAVTADLYRIDIDDRIVLSGRFDLDDPNIGAILESLGVGEAQFFVNSVDTRTRGLDLTVAHTAQLGAGTLRSYLAANRSLTDVTAINAPPALVGREDVLLSERERLFIEQGGPRTKATLGFDFDFRPVSFNARIIHFGSQTLGTFSGPPVPNAHYRPKTSADVGFTWHISDNAKLSFGGTNVFDVFPSRQDPDETDNGHLFDSVQFGLNGAAWFARYWVRF
jgi:iron complex outermembrane recepter protein